MASSPPTTQSRAADVFDHECRAVLERAANSKFFEKSARSRELLTYLCNVALAHDERPITEQQIGTAVFGREPGYDTAVDTIARVQVSQLRKKLREYFASEGSREPLIIDIPSGSYVPVFRRRDITAPADHPIESPAPPRKLQRQLPWKAVSAVLLVISCALLVWLLLDHPHSKPLSATATDSALNTFWGPLTASLHELPIVISDANLMIVSDMLGRTVSLHEYRDPNYPESLIEQFKDNDTRELAKHILGNYYTGTQDARVIKYLASVGLPLSVVPAREFRMVAGTPENLILIGHNRGNPWMELFEADMNFHYEWPASAKVPAIQNRNPRSGEKSEYAVVWQQRGYCIVSLRPKPDGHGNALLIIGSDLSSLDAGGRFLTEEKWIRTLYNALGLKTKSPTPYFEVLLETDLLTSGSPKFRIIASRTSSTP